MLLGDMLELNARKTPARDAVIFADAGMRSTYAELADRVRRLANAVCGLASPGDRVALLGENSMPYLECYYGVPSAGTALTMLNYRLHPKEWVWVLNDSESRVLVADRAYAEQILDLRSELPFLEHVVVVGDPLPGALSYEDLLAAASSSLPSSRPDEDDTAWILYTSGTTGRPKGAMLSHRNLVTAITESVVEYTPSPAEQFLHAMPMCHVSGYLIPTNQFRGGTVVVQGAWDPERWMEIVDGYGITSGGFAPVMMNMLLRHPKINEFRLDSLTSMGYGASIMPVEILRETIARFGPIVYAGFGMTELAGNVLTLDKAAHVRAAKGEEHLLAAAGSAMCLADVRVFDEDDRECAPGEVGEIVVQGAQTTTGYFNNPDATQEAYRSDWFHSGDLARRDEEGFFYIVDRKKDMIISGGENVYSTEVENAIYTHPSVAEAAVIGLPHEKWGEAVTAIVVLKVGAAATEEEIIQACRQNLAGYKRPQRVIFTDAIPKNVGGKVLKRELRDAYSGASVQEGSVP
jgi:acyl-CoA synthetase (AMP-forming)/AMP-acid ligase II